MESRGYLKLLFLVCVSTIGSSRSILGETSFKSHHDRPDFKDQKDRDTKNDDVNAKISQGLPHVLRICAFNIKTFGRAKMSDAEIADIISQIVLRYDVILIQEIRDSSQESVIQLWSMVNQTRPYGLSISDRLGRTTYKEQYAYFYRLDRLALIDAHQFNDETEDLFEREPYSVRLRPVGAGSDRDIAFIGLHAKPDHAVSEISNLIEVYDDVMKTWMGIQDIVLMGDFNAACSYASKTDLEQLPIYNQPLFRWLLGFDSDTTTSTNTDCAYDRFIVTGTNIENAVIPGSAGIYKFEEIFDLDYERMRDVSDHYPIEFEIY